jgi:heme/copper-type cytochrome/quinol oxidase subunit 1
MNLTFFPMHFAGMQGMPRRIYTFEPGQGWDIYNAMSSAGAMIFPLAMSIFIYNFFRSRKVGAIAGADPWGAGTLEWTIPSPPPEYNFAKIPTVTSRYPLWEGKEPDIESARANRVEGKTATDLGIILPYNTIKPLIVAGGMVVMFCGLITTHMLIYIGAAIMVGALYAWLLSPLEPEHH